MRISIIYVSVTCSGVRKRHSALSDQRGREGFCKWAMDPQRWSSRFVYCLSFLLVWLSIHEDAWAFGFFSYFHFEAPTSRLVILLLVYLMVLIWFIVFKLVSCFSDDFLKKKKRKENRKTADSIRGLWFWSCFHCM